MIIYTFLIATMIFLKKFLNSQEDITQNNGLKGELWPQTAWVQILGLLFSSSSKYISRYII